MSNNEPQLCTKCETRDIPLTYKVNGGTRYTCRHCGYWWLSDLPKVNGITPKRCGTAYIGGHKQEERTR